MYVSKNKHNAAYVRGHYDAWQFILRVCPKLDLFSKILNSKCSINLYYSLYFIFNYFFFAYIGMINELLTHITMICLYIHFAH